MTTMHKMIKVLSVVLLLLLFSVGYGKGRSDSQPPAVVSTIDCKDQTEAKVTFSNPVGITIDSSGNLYIVDNNSIRKIAPEGITIFLAGNPDGETGSDDGTGSEAGFMNPTGIAIDKNGIIYVADAGNNAVRKIDQNGVVTTLACVDGQTGLATSFYELVGITVDNAGNLYVTANQTIQKITPDGKTTILAGEKALRGFADGTGTKARFCCPSGIIVDVDENLYVADTKNNSIRKISPDGVVTTLAGQAGKTGAQDGIGKKARFNYPWGITIDKNDNLYVTDAMNYTIRKITPDGTVSTIAGKPGKTGFVDGTDARFGFPLDITSDNSGNLYVADTNNYLIRKIVLP